MILILSGVLCEPAASDVPDSQRQEVLHLLEFIRDTDCEIERNGKSYNGKDAVSHVQKKYAYFRDHIQTTEEFIDYSASKSTMSGRHYLVICGDQGPVPTKDWLMEELNAYRSEKKG